MAVMHFNVSPWHCTLYSENLTFPGALSHSKQAKDEIISAFEQSDAKVNKRKGKLSNDNARQKEQPRQQAARA